VTTISKSHQWFSDYLKDQKALTNPEDFLGPNWQDVINFWLYIDGLSSSEMEKMNDRYYALGEDVRQSAWSAAYEASSEVVEGRVRNAVLLVTDYGVFGYATRELISHHKLLEQNKTLLALPLCLKS
jgi:hypothetical protein